MTTQHNDLNRTGANPNETILNTSNVNVNTFGKLFSHAVDGQIYAQPLYVPNVQIPGQGTHNVVFVCTENNSVYAFDADNAATWAPLWQVNFGPTTAGVFDSILTVGITSTPVIDTTSGTLYVVDNTILNGSTTVYQLHALDITTGKEKFNGPVTIQGSVTGTGDGSSSGTLTFDPTLHFQRPGLLLSNGKVYVAFGSHGNDQVPWHGWMFAFNAATLQQTSILCLTPNGGGGGVWTAGMGLAADASGNLFISTGNGTFDVNSGGKDYGDAIVKVGTSNGLAVEDYFTPWNQQSLAIADADLGSGGAILIPNTSYVLGGGKDGRVFLLNRNNLGQYNSATDQVVQEWQATTNFLLTGEGGSYGSDWVYYNSTLYLWGNSDFLRAFSFNGSTFNTTPTSVGTIQAPAAELPYGQATEPAMSLSANGTVPGTGIIWASYPLSGNSDGYPTPGIFRAFETSDLTKELWNSNLNSGRDNAGSWAKWSAPTIANGKVYLATSDGAFDAYGLLSPGGGGSLLGTGDSSETAANLTVEGTLDWEHWGDASLNRKANVTPQLSPYSIVGSGTVTAYNPDLRPLSWTDGTPTASSANNLNGIYINSTGNGFSFTAPAGTSTQTLIVHVGGWNSGGTLTAHLSDESAPDFIDTIATNSGEYDRNYRLTYNAATPNQALRVSWVMASGTGNVSLSAAALSNGSSVTTASITATAGTPQSAAVGAAFATALQAKVLDTNNNPVSGASVTFTAPSSGASGTFSGSSTVTTNSSGVATAPTFTANSVTGSYTVTATVAGVATPASFSLTNTTVGVSGSLSGLGNSNSTAANLTTEGTLDWVHWGDGSLNRKANVAVQLSTYGIVGNGPAIAYNPDLRPLSWTDGTPTTSSTNNLNGLYINSTGNGFSFTAPADTSTRTLIVHAGGWNSGATLTAHLSDSSAANFTEINATTSGEYDRNYTLTYNAATAGQTLTVTWVMSSGSGNVSLSAAALSLGGSATTASITATAGTPQSATVGNAFTTALQAKVLDSSNNPVSGAPVTFTAPSSGASGTFSGSSTVTTNSSGVATAPTFTANSATGSYTVTASVAGVATPASFSLTNTQGETITATAGSPQSTTVGTAFATALQAKVLDTNNNPVSGAAVTFTVPSSGAGGTFSGSSTVTTNSSGVATAPAFTANSVAGSYTVTAGVVGAATPASFNLTNTAVGVSGALSGVGSSNTTAANLTTEGTLDWVHWGDGILNRKASVTAQLSDVSEVGVGSVYTYNPDLRPLSWTDGTPTASSTNNLNGLYINATGNGFSFTAPADTSTRTVIVHAGGWNSGGTLTAHLSDGSAADFTDINATTSGEYDRNYILIYNAAGAGQTLTVTWKMSSGSGNVSVSAAALSLGGSATIASIAATAGTPQSATVGTAFATALQAKVLDTNNNPVSGASVTFAAPSSGASGAFSGSTTVTTNSSGVATAPTFTANSVAGSYSVTASVAGVATPASFNLTNTAVGVTGALSGAGNSNITAANLTLEGTLDWVHWGDGILNRKANVTAQLSTYSEVGVGSVYTYNPDLRPLSWTDGTPTASSTNNLNGLYIDATGNGFSFTAPADTSTRTVIVHVGGWNSGGTLTAHLSDSSAANFTEINATTSGEYDRNYTLTYNAASAGQTLMVTWVMSSGSGNVSLSAAALSPGGSATTASITATGGTPQSTTVGTSFATALQATVLDTNNNPVSGASVTFTAPASGAGGTFSGSATVTTNSSGVATAPTFTANSAAGSYTVTASVAGVATPASFSLTNTGVTITATTGTPQSTTVGTAFTTALQAKVLDSNNNPVSGASVTFAAPANGASGTFGGSTTVTTNTSGVASAPTFTANSVAGSYTVTASVAGAATPASFSLTNTASAVSGALVGAGNSNTTAANLTLEGSSDWVHWGDGILNRKANVTAQLSTYGIVGAGPAYTYNPDLRPLSWTDGTPTTSSTNNLNGLYINATGNGFSFTAPADTSTRTLIVHVGGWNSGGTLTAHLSDSSAANFTEINATTSGEYDRNYTLTYNAASAGQTLMVTWVMSSGSGNVSLSAAALSLGGSATTASITAAAGTPQSATVGTAFATALQAKVLDTNNNPVSGASVTFTAPSSGAGGTFSGSSTVTTNSSGIATAPTFTANSVTGSYTVTASVAGVATPASFSLTNTSAGATGAMSGAGNSNTTAANLTTEGALDWVHWGDGILNRKANVTAQISTYSEVGVGSMYTYNPDLRPLSWTDGTPTGSSTNNTNGLYINNTGNGFSFTAPAGTAAHTLTVHVGGWNSGGTLTAHLSDGSAADFTDITPNTNGQYDRNYTLTYSAATAGQTLTVTWKMSIGTGNVTLSGAALQ